MIEIGKVYLKTIYDYGMKMDIPHSYNFANAMYGFRELRAEIIPYHVLDEAYDSIEREDIVLDYIDQCNEVFGKFGVKLRVPDYPDVLKEFLGRKMWLDTMDSISSNEEK